jgi:hypothetical protein
MSNKVQFRRGTDAERGTVVLDSGEPGWTTDTKELYVGDGATYGGILVTGGAGGGAGTLCALSDVNCAGTVNGKVLTYQNGTWIAETPAGGGDMLISQYVTGAGTVYNATRLGGDPLATVQAHNVEASKITSGTIGLARIPVVDDARIPDLETLSYGAAFATAQIPSVGAYKIAAGTLAVERQETLDNLNGTVALAQVPTMDDGHIPDVDGLSYGAAFAAAQIPNLAASKVTSGTFNVNRIDTLANLKGTVTAEKVASLPTSKITSGTFNLTMIPTVDDARIPDLETLSYGAAFATAQVPPIGAYKIATGTFAADRVPALANLKGTVTDAKIPDLETLSYGAAFAAAQIPNLDGSKVTTGTFNADRIPILPTSRITTGTFGIARIPSITNAYLAGEITSDKISALSGTAITYPLNADTVGTTAIKSAGVGNDELAASGLDIAKCTVGTAGAARIPVLPTSRITTGTFSLNRIPTIDDARIPNLETLSYGAAFADAQIPNLTTSKITTGSFNADRIPVLPTSRITSGTFADARIPDVGVVAINYVIDGGGTVIIAGTVGFLEVPFACHVDRWTLLADQHGSVVIDIWRDGYSNYPPTDADSMPGTTNMPAISGTVAAQGTDLSGWGTQGISSGDILAYHVDSCTSIELCTIALKVRKT